MHKLALKFGANVYGRNKHCGQLTKVVVEPHIWRLTDLIIEDGLIFKRAIILPVSQVEDTLGQTINLKITNDQFQAFQTYGEATIEKGTSNWPASKAVGEIEYASLSAANIPNLTITREKTRLGIGNNLLVLDHTINVACLDGNIGHLSHIVVDAQDYLISDLVFKQGTLFPKYYIVSTHQVDSLNEVQTQIAITRLEAAHLPEYTFIHHR
jgi:uncharacterized protein YrrD